MSFYVRKIDRAKWPDKYSGCVEDISADAITANLRTGSGALSLWKIDDKSELDDVVVALATSRKNEKITKISMALINDSSIEDVFAIKNTPGDTAVGNYTSLHWDIIGLHGGNLVSVAEIVARSLSGSQEEKYTETRVKHLLRKARDSGIINMKLLEESLQAAIENL